MHNESIYLENLQYPMAERQFHCFHNLLQTITIKTFHYYYGKICCGFNLVNDKRKNFWKVLLVAQLKQIYLENFYNIRMYPTQDMALAQISFFLGNGMQVFYNFHRHRFSCFNEIPHSRYLNKLIFPLTYLYRSPLLPCHMCPFPIDSFWFDWLADPPLRSPSDLVCLE